MAKTTIAIKRSAKERRVAAASAGSTSKAGLRAMLVAVAAVAGWWLWNRRRKRQNGEGEEASESTPAEAAAASASRVQSGSSGRRPAPVVRSSKGQSRVLANHKKNRKRRREDRPAREAKRDARGEHEPAGPQPPVEEPDDNLNTTYHNYTYFKGGRRDHLTATPPRKP